MSFRMRHWVKRMRHSRGVAGRRTWSLETSAGSEARLVHRGGVVTPAVMHVDIAKLGEGAKEWHVKLLQHSYEIVAGTRYSVSFRARAAEPRPVGCAVGNNHDPWMALGEYHEHVVTREWTPFWGAFTGLADDPDARLFFDLARSEAWVEISDVVLRNETNERDLSTFRRR